MDFDDVDHLIRLRSNDTDFRCGWCGGKVIAHEVEEAANHYITDHECRLLYIGAEGVETGNGIVQQTVIIVGWPGTALALRDAKARGLIDVSCGAS